MVKECQRTSRLVMIPRIAPRPSPDGGGILLPGEVTRPGAMRYDSAAMPRDPSERVFELTGCFGVRLDERREHELQAFYEGCRDYFELVTGQPPSPSEAADLIAAVPRGKTRDDKFVIGLFDAPGHLVGVLDVIRDFPKAGEWYLGLLLFEPTLRGKKLGDRVYHRLEEWVRAQGGIAIHLIVEEVNLGALRRYLRPRLRHSASSATVRTPTEVRTDAAANAEIVSYSA